jgi:hypothetical protein
VAGVRPVGHTAGAIGGVVARRRHGQCWAAGRCLGPAAQPAGAAIHPHWLVHMLVRRADGPAQIG